MPARPPGFKNSEGALLYCFYEKLICALKGAKGGAALRRRFSACWGRAFSAPPRPSAAQRRPVILFRSEPESFRRFNSGNPRASTL
ncbi:MAG: hypothetical protein DBY09_01255 [Selenomonadales bacterium]|nr:MAG: hypothetical protein DBY09_01255 [Selenomonadales bacterium]